MMELSLTRSSRIFALVVIFFVSIGSWASSSLAFESGSTLSVATTISDVCQEMNISVTPDQAKQWESDVRLRIQAVDNKIASIYPIPATREALTSGCILGLKNKPGVEYKFHKFYTANVADLKDLKTGERHLVNVAGLSKGVLILRDFMRETSLLVKEAESALNRLQKEGADIRQFVDRMVSGSATAYELLEKSVSSENLDELKENEAKATAEIEKAKEVLENLKVNDESTVKGAAEVYTLLSKAEAVLQEVGADGVTLEKEVYRLRTRLQHLRASSGMETRFNQEYIDRAKAAFDDLTKAYREGMNGVERQRVILQQAQESTEKRDNVLTLLNNVDKTFKRIGSMANQVATTADASKLSKQLEVLSSSLAQLKSTMNEVEEAVISFKKCNEELEAKTRAVENESRRALALRLLGEARRQETNLQSKIDKRSGYVPKIIKVAVAAVAQAMDKGLTGIQASVVSANKWLQEKASVAQLKDVKEAMARAQVAGSAANKATQRLSKLIVDAEAQIESRGATVDELEGALNISAVVAQVKKLRKEAFSSIKVFEDKSQALKSSVGISGAHADVLKGTLQNVSRNLTQLAAGGEEFRKYVESLLGTFNVNAEESKVQRADVNRSTGKALTAAKEIAKLVSKIDAQEAQLQNASLSFRASAEAMKTKLLGQGQDDIVGKAIQLVNYRSEALKLALVSLEQGVKEAVEMGTRFKHAYSDFQQESKSLGIALDGPPDVVSDPDTLSVDDMDKKDAPADKTSTPDSPGLASHAVAFEASVSGVLNIADALQTKLENAKGLRKNAERVAGLHKLAILSLEGALLDPEASTEVRSALHAGKVLQANCGGEITEKQQALAELDRAVGGIGGIDGTAVEILRELSRATVEADKLLENGLLEGIPVLEKLLLDANKFAEAIEDVKVKGADGQTEFLEYELRRKEKLSRLVASKLSEFVESVLTVSRKIIKTLGRVESFCQSHDASLMHQSSGLRRRRLGNSSQSTWDVIQSLKVEAKELETKALNAASEIKQRMEMLSSLLAPTDSAVPADGQLPSPPNTSTSTTTAKPTEDEYRKEGIDQKALYAVCIASGALLLFAIVCGASYAYKHRKALKKSESNASTLDAEGGSLPTKDFDPRGPFPSRPSLESAAAQELSALSQSPHITPVVATVTEESCLEGVTQSHATTRNEQYQLGTKAKSLDRSATTKKQYMVDEHYLVARGVGVDFAPSPLATPRGGPLDLSEDASEIQRSFAGGGSGSTMGRRPQDEMRRRREFEELTHEVEMELSGKRE